MNSEHEHEHRVGARQRSSPFSRIERLSPLMVALYLALLAITVMFVMLVVAYVVTRQRSGVPTGLHALPRYFSLSTIVLVASSYTIGQASRAAWAPRCCWVPFSRACKCWAGAS